MAVCRNAFHNGVVAHTCYKFTKVLSTEFLFLCVVLMEAIFPCFNLKPGDCNLVSTQTFLIIWSTHTGKALVGIYPIGMGLIFSKMYPGSSGV